MSRAPRPPQKPPRTPPREGPPSREIVLDYLARNPTHGAKRDIARGLDVSTEHKPELRRILNALEAEGALVRTAKRAFSPAEQPPPTGIVRFERIDRDGELIRRALSKDARCGPDTLISLPPAAKHRQVRIPTAPAVAVRPLTPPVQALVRSRPPRRNSNTHPPPDAT